MKSVQPYGCCYFALHSFLGRIPMKGSLAAVSAVATLLFAGNANAANDMSIYYYETPTTSTGDFGPCCSSPSPATLENISTGASLGAGGLPVSVGGPNPIIDVNGSGEILWWSPGVSSPNPITATGSGTISVGTVASPLTYTMYAPNSTGTDDATYFETARLLGTIHGTGVDVTFNVSSDDDTLVYLNGLYVGGNPGVHGETSTLLNLGTFTGPESLEIFYADRAQVGAVLNLGIDGATISGVPELSTWVMMALGFAGLGFAGYRTRKTAALGA
jgi:hypothetical protein